MITVYVVLLTVTMLALFIGGCVGYAYRDKVNHFADEMLTNSMKTWSNTTQGPWVYAHTNFECCGVKDYKDWIEESEQFKYWSYGYWHYNGVENNNRKRRSDDGNNGTVNQI